MGQRFEAAVVQADRPVQGSVQQGDFATGEGAEVGEIDRGAVEAGGMAALHEQLAVLDGDSPGTGDADVAGAGAALGREGAGVDVDAVGGGGAPRHQADVAGEVGAGIGANLGIGDPDRPVALKQHVAAGVTQGDCLRLWPRLSPAGHGLP